MEGSARWRLSEKLLLHAVDCLQTHCVQLEVGRARVKRHTAYQLGCSDRVAKLNRFFASYRSGDEYDRNAIIHVMNCSSWFPGAVA